MSQQFIRGSQISFHYLRMFFQSLKHILTLSFVVFAAYFAWHLYRTANFYVFNPMLFIKFLTSQAYSPSDNAYPMTFIGPSHKVVTITVKQYATWYQTDIAPKAIFWLKDSFYSGLKYFLISFFLITSFFIYKGNKQKQTKHLRGAKLVSALSLSKKIFYYNLKHFHFNPYKLAGISYPKDSEHQHTIMTGGSGTGKTQVMLDLVEQIRNKSAKAVIYDRMGVYVEKFYDPSKDIILNPFDHRSEKWSFFIEGSGRNTFENMAKSLIEESKGGDPFWANAARSIVIEASLLLAARGNLSNKSLCDFLLKSTNKDFSNFLKKTIVAAIADDTSDKTIASIRSVISTYTKSLQLLEDSDDYFSIKKWVKDKNKSDSILFLSSRIDSHETAKPLLTLWLDLAIISLMTLNQKQQDTMWFIIDEAPSLQKLPVLSTGLAESRQFGGAFIISMQLISQLREIYGRDGSQTISGLCRNRVTFATPDAETADWCASNLGKKEILSAKENISFGASELRDGVNISENKETESLVIPSQIMNLNNLELYIKFSNNFPVAKAKITYQERGSIAEKFIEKSSVVVPSVTEIMEFLTPDSKYLSEIKKEPEFTEHEDDLEIIESEEEEFTESEDDAEDSENEDSNSEDESKEITESKIATKFF